MLFNLGLGFTLSGLIGLTGYRKKALSRSGVLGAIILGSIVFGLGGWIWGAILIAFFVSSSILSFFQGENKTELVEKFDKGHQRDFGQTLANGGVAALCAIGHIIWPGQKWWYGFLGAMATVNADTWATELGVLSRTKPRLITTGVAVPPGTSGGITWFGTGAALAGATFIGMVGIAATLLKRIFAFGEKDAPKHLIRSLLAAGLGGLFGALFDSFLGATLQAIYYCPVCKKETEQRWHKACGRTKTQKIRGMIWLNNDLVNFFSALIGAGAAIGIGLWRRSSKP